LEVVEGVVVVTGAGCELEVEEELEEVDWEAWGTLFFSATLGFSTTFLPPNKNLDTKTTEKTETNP
jgi:hypothetical protein